MLHPEDEDSAAEQKVAAITGIEALGGGAKVTKTPLALCWRLACEICRVLSQVLIKGV